MTKEFTYGWMMHGKIKSMDKIIYSIGKLKIIK